jgi:hypothetical protein
MLADTMQVSPDGSDSSESSDPYLSVHSLYSPTIDFKFTT